LNKKSITTPSAIPIYEGRREEKSGETPQFLRLRWDGDALLKNYQPRLFYYFYYQGCRGPLSTFFAGRYALTAFSDKK
jgi:hypothetical protein